MNVRCSVQFSKNMLSCWQNHQMANEIGKLFCILTENFVLTIHLISNAERMWPFIIGMLEAVMCYFSLRTQSVVLSYIDSYHGISIYHNYKQFFSINSFTVYCTLLFFYLFTYNRWRIRSLISNNFHNALIFKCKSNGIEFKILILFLFPTLGVLWPNKFTQPYNGCAVVVCPSHPPWCIM